MESRLRSECGRTVLEVTYDPASLNWNQAIEAAYRLHGLRPGQLSVIAYPEKFEEARNGLLQGLPELSEKS